MSRTITARRNVQIPPSLVKVKTLVERGGITRTEILAACEPWFDWEGDECVVNVDAEYIRKRQDAINDHDARRRQRWLNFDRDRELADAYRKGKEAVARDARLPDHANLELQQAAGLAARTKFAKENPPVGTPDGFASEVEWFAWRYPEEERAHRALLNQIDFERGLTA